MESSRTLLLVDGTAVLYRAFYAIRELSTRAGVPTNAVFGFIRMFRQMREAWGATHAVVAFDGGAPEARLAVQPDYKANRPPMPAALRPQGDTIREYLTRCEVAWCLLPGEEADDLLATLAAQAAPACKRVLIATSDKDMYQLVDDVVRIVPVAGKGEMMGAAEVEARTGVTPAQIPGWLALTGDSVDNIPGVSGIGPKTAARLIRQYGSLDALLAQVPAMPDDRIRAALVAQQDVVNRNARMVGLNRGVACRLDWERARLRPAQPDRVLPLLKDLEFESMARELQQGDLFG